MTPSISIISPSFQQGRYLSACIESVMGQGYPALEYMVLDGGSTDGSVDVLKGYGNRFPWRSRPDGGQVVAVNEGLRRARGDIVGYLNSDDRLAPNALKQVAAFFEAHPEVQVVYGRGRMIDSEGNYLREFPTEAFSFPRLIDHCFICQPAAFWRRSLHERFGWLDETFAHSFDYEFWIRLARKGANFHHLPEVLAEARDHSEAKSRRELADIFGEIRRLQLKHLGYCSRTWWEQHLRYLRDERRGAWRLLPGKRDQQLHRLAWVPYLFWRRYW